MAGYFSSRSALQRANRFCFFHDLGPFPLSDSNRLVFLQYKEQPLKLPPLSFSAAAACIINLDCAELAESWPFSKSRKNEVQDSHKCRAAMITLPSLLVDKNTAKWRRGR
jgi:hypothetical protein